MKVLIAQMEVVPGCPQVNKKKMLEVLRSNKAKEADVVAFPEMCIPGYLLGDMWERFSFIEECVECGNEIVEFTSGLPDTHVIFGNVVTVPTSEGTKICNEDGRPRKYNGAIIAKDGVCDLSIKTLMPNYREFDDSRHFYSSIQRELEKFSQLTDEKQFCLLRYLKDCVNTYYTESGESFSVLLCEDCWDDDYSVVPMEFLGNVDFVFNISCSPFTNGKASKRDRVFNRNATQHGVTMVYVNCVGAQNNGKNLYTFDGDSRVYSGGESVTLYPFFEEGFSLFNFRPNELPEPTWCNPYTAHILDDFDRKDPIPHLYKALLYGTSKFIEQNNLSKAVIGASGGIDSCVSACIWAQALDSVYGEGASRERLVLVNMPSQYNSKKTINIFRELVDNLDCISHVMPIQDSLELTKSEFEDAGIELSKFDLENVQARDRSARILAAVASAYGGVFTCNGNKSELTVGYATLWGDLAGCFACLADVWKSQVYEIAVYINQRNMAEPDLFYKVPPRAIAIPPSAELSEEQNAVHGKGDPLDYEYHDKLFATWVERWNRLTPIDLLEMYCDGSIESELGCSVYDRFESGKDFVLDLERWWNNFDGLAVSKRVVTPCILSVSRRAFGFDMRESQGPPYYSKRYAEIREKILQNN